MVKIESVVLSSFDELRLKDEAVKRAAGRWLNLGLRNPVAGMGYT